MFTKPVVFALADGARMFLASPPRPDRATLFIERGFLDVMVDVQLKTALAPTCDVAEALHTHEDLPRPDVRFPVPSNLQGPVLTGSNLHIQRHGNSSATARDMATAQPTAQPTASSVHLIAKRTPSNRPSP